MQDSEQSGAFASPLDAALRYAEHGWPVFPCKPDKKPYTEHGFLEATTDAAIVVAWWRKWPNAQIGIACGAAGLCVVDLDMGDGKDGIAALARLEDEHGGHFCGLIASTPRGGRHLYYLMPDPPVRGSTNVQKIPGIDVRAEGGYVVAPSPASPGREWIVGEPFGCDADGELDIAGMPEWVEKLVRSGGRALAASSIGGDSGVVMTLNDLQVAAIKRALAFLDADPRDTWIRVGMALKSTSAGQQAFDLWTEWSQTSPRWPSFDFQTHVGQWKSIREYFVDGHEITLGTLFHMARDAGYVPSLADDVAVVEAAPPPVPPPPPTPRRPFDRGLMNVPGLVGDVAHWMLESSTRQQPAMCLASAIAMLGAVLGRRVATPTDLRTNVYCLGIGETACGKDPSVRLPHLLLTRAGLGALVGPGEWKSDSGLRAALLDAPSHVACCDEFTKLLDSMAGRQVPAHLKGIKRYLLELWGASNTVHLSPAYANRQLNKPVIIEQPNLCLYGTGVPSELFSSLDRGALSDGFLNRMLFFFADEQLPKRNKVGRAEPPASLVDRLKALDKRTSAEQGNLASLSGAAPTAKVVAMTPEAEAMLADLENENDKRIVRMRETGEALSDLWVRFGAHVAKLALIRTASDAERPIGVEDLAWARDLVLWCTERTMAEAESRVADSAQEALTKRVLRIIVEGGAAGLSSSDLTRKTQWLRRGDRKDIIATLVEGGEVLTESEESATKAAVVYVASRFRVEAGAD